MDSGDVGMRMTVQEAIESDDGEQAESDEIWGGKRWLDPRQVKEGRLEEVRRLKHFDVYEVVDEWEATGQIVDAKWVERQIGSVVRSRIVARQFATKSLEHLLAGHAKCYSPQGHTVESGDGQGRGLAFGGRDISVSSGPSRDRPIRTATDRPKRKGETLDAEAGNGRSQDSEQVVAGPLCVSRGRGAGSGRGRSLTHAFLRSWRTERSRPFRAMTWSAVIQGRTWRP